MLLVAVIAYVLVGSALPGWTPWPGPSSGADGPPTAGESAGPEQEPPDSTAGTYVTVQPSADGSFVFLISDEVNAIGDFDSLIIDIAGIGLKMEDGVENGEGPWVGWGDRLHLSSSFEVTSNMTTHFVYDLTVVAAGGPSGRAGYILRPQAGQSGVGRPFRRVEPASGEGPPLGPPGAGASGSKAGQPEHDRGEKALGGPDNGTPVTLLIVRLGLSQYRGPAMGGLRHEQNRATRGAGRGATHKPCHRLQCRAVWRRWRSQFRGGACAGGGGADSGREGQRRGHTAHGNLRLLVSDEPNAIGNFTALWVDISSLASRHSRTPAV
ncbi:MAG: hypothetical protein ACOC6A_03705 [Chloroflexota bacterium]